jgi:Outer membrane protein beta-barrel domain
MVRWKRQGVWWVWMMAVMFVPMVADAGPGYVNFVLGQKQFDEEWDPVDKQPAFGVEAAFGPSTWPVHIMTFLQRSSKSKDAEADDGSGGTVTYTLEADTWEFGGGVNKTFGEDKFHPYIGAGAVYAKVDVTAKYIGFSGSDDANGFGFWGGGGAFYRLGTRFNVGGTVRYSSANVDFNAFDTGTVEFGGAELDAGGVTFGFLLGWGWPATTP